LIPVGSSVVVAGGGLAGVELAIALGNVDEGRVVNVEKVIGVVRRAFIDDEATVFESCARDDLGRMMERKRRGEESVSDLEQ
jgi:2-polyprenyl-6-methoxyphenol hydroxylase-like FAD-dependent oxidoreductase